MPKISKLDSVSDAKEPSALAGEYLRAFTGALSSMHDFGPFLEALKLVVGEDPFLEGSVKLSDPDRTGGGLLPDFDKMDGSDYVVSVSGATGNLGYMKYSGRRDQHAFSAEDMHLMGSIASFISALVLQANQFRLKQQATKVLRYLINQLPLGVICYGGAGEVIVESDQAANILGGIGQLKLAEVVRSEDAFVEGRVQCHLTLEDKHLYAEGRRLKVEDGLEVIAFILYDLSKYRERLLMDLEREAFRSEARGTSLTFVLLEQEDHAGAICKRLRASAEALQIKPGGIQPLNAFACGCVFTGLQPRKVRFLLKSILEGESSSTRVAILPFRGIGDEAAPADQMIREASDSLSSIDRGLLPELLVLDPYPGVAEALSLITSEVCKLTTSNNCKQAAALLGSGCVDGIFLDLDSFSPEELSCLQKAAVEVGDRVEIYYSSHRQPEMARERAGLDEDAIIFQKPFQADKIVECLNLQFNLA